MTTTPSLDKIVSLTESFQQALSNRIGAPINLNPSSVSKISTKEYQGLIDAALDLHDEAMAYMAVGDNDDAFLRKSLQFTEKFAAIAKKILPTADLQTMIPPELKNPNSIAILQSENAPVLASLCS